MERRGGDGKEFIRTALTHIQHFHPFDLFLSGQGKLGQLRRSKLSKDLTSQRAPEGARVSQNELE